MLTILRANRTLAKTFDGPRDTKGTVYMVRRFGAFPYDPEDLGQLATQLTRVAAEAGAAVSLSHGEGVLTRDPKLLAPPATTNILWADLDVGVPSDVDTLAWVREHVEPAWGFGVGFICIDSQRSGVNGGPRRLHVISLLPAPIPWDQARAMAVAAGGDPSVYNAASIIFVGPPVLRSGAYSAAPVKAHHRVSLVPGVAAVAATVHGTATLPDQESGKTALIREKAPLIAAIKLRQADDQARRKTKLLQQVKARLEAGRTAHQKEVYHPDGNVRWTRTAGPTDISPGSAARGEWDDVFKGTTEADIQYALDQGRAPHSSHAIATLLRRVMAPYICEPTRFVGQRWSKVRALAYSIGRYFVACQEKSGRYPAQVPNRALAARALRAVAVLYSLPFELLPNLRPLLVAGQWNDLLDAIEYAAPQADQQQRKHYEACAQDAKVAGIYIELARHWWYRRGRPTRQRVEAEAERRLEDVAAAPQGARQKTAYKAMSWAARWVAHGWLPSMVLDAVAHVAAGAFRATMSVAAALRRAASLRRRFMVEGDAATVRPRLAYKLLASFNP